MDRVSGARATRPSLTPPARAGLDLDPGHALVVPAPVVLALVDRAAPGPMDLVDPAGLAVPVVLGLAVPAGLVEPVLVGRAVPGPTARVGPAVRVVPVGPAGLVEPVLVGRAVPDPTARVVRVGLAVLSPVVRADPVNQVAVTVLVGPAPLGGRADPVNQVAVTVLVGPGGLADPLVREDPVDPDLTAQVGRAGLVDPVGHLRRRTFNTASTTGVVLNGVARTTRRTDSAHRITEHRLRRGTTDSAGTAGLPPERRRPTGTARRLLAAGTVRLLPAAGTSVGTGRHATSVSHSAISDHSGTTATTPSRSSTRCSAVGDSGSSASGSRCTDLTV